MKRLILFATLFFSVQSYGQLLSGTAVESGRVITSETPLTITYKQAGTVTVEVAIDRTGKVTSAKVVDAEGIKGTPALMPAQNAAKKLTFTPGTGFAKFEHARVKFTYVVE